MNSWMRLAVSVFVVLPLSACAVPVGDPNEEPEPVAKAESELPIVPICASTTIFTGPHSSSAEGLKEDIDLWGIGDRDDVGWVEQTLSPPSSFRPRVSVSTIVDVSTASVELEAVPFAGYTAGGVNLLLEVKDGARVLCSQKIQLVSHSTPAGSADEALAPTTRTLTCSYDATGTTAAPVARVSIETWATVAGLSTAFIHGQAQRRELKETRCMHLVFLP